MKKYVVLRAALLHSTNGKMTIAVLPTMHTDKRDKLQCNLHLSSTTGTAERGSNHRMCELRMPRLFFC